MNKRRRDDNDEDERIIKKVKSQAQRTCSGMISIDTNGPYIQCDKGHIGRILMNVYSMYGSLIIFPFRTDDCISYTSSNSFKSFNTLRHEGDIYNGLFNSERFIIECLRIDDYLRKVKIKTNLISCTTYNGTKTKGHCAPIFYILISSYINNPEDSSQIILIDPIAIPYYLAARLYKNTILSQFNIVRIIFDDNKISYSDLDKLGGFFIEKR